MYAETYIVKVEAAIKQRLLERILNLDELLDLCRAQYPQVSDLQLLSKMRVKITSKCCNGYLAHQSMHDFWIIYYMHIKHNKMWVEGDNRWT